jgi:hypothetical protein
MTSLSWSSCSRPFINITQTHSSQASELTRGCSQQSAPAAVPMSRKRSSTSQHGHTPFSSNGASIPPLAIADFQTSHDEPFNNYTVGNASKIRRSDLREVHCHKFLRSQYTIIQRIGIPHRSTISMPGRASPSTLRLPFAAVSASTRRILVFRYHQTTL